MDDKKIHFLKSITFSAIIAIIFVAAITIIADLIPPIKDWLKNTFTHHWVGKSILSVLIFFVFYFIFYYVPSKSDQTIERLNKSLNYLFWASIFSSLAIIVFFIWEAFLK